MKIVTGYKGVVHITSNDDQGLLKGVVGPGLYVLPVGNEFATTIVSANEIEIADGEGVFQGVHFRTEPNTVDSVTIENGSLGMQRCDIICAQYSKDILTGVESMTWEVIKGTPAASDPQPPTYTAGDVLNGDTLAQLPLYYVWIDGLAIDSITISGNAKIDSLWGVGARSEFIIRSYTGTLPVGTAADSTTVMAATPLGYELVHWISAVSTGWVLPLYVENPTAANPKVWKPNTSYIVGGLGGSFTVYGLFRRLAV